MAEGGRLKLDQAVLLMLEGGRRSYGEWLTAARWPDASEINATHHTIADQQNCFRCQNDITSATSF
jgi:hypothetical protein